MADPGDARLVLQNLEDAMLAATNAHFAACLLSLLGLLCQGGNGDICSTPDLFALFVRRLREALGSRDSRVLSEALLTVFRVFGGDKSTREAQAVRPVDAHANPCASFTLFCSLGL